MKKLLSLLLCLAMLFAVPVYVTAEDDSEEKEWSPSYTTVEALEKSSDVVARFAVGSDVHINYSYSAKKFRNAYSVLGNLGGVDAFILAGDLTEMGKPYEYELLMDIIADNSKELTVDKESFELKGSGNSAPVNTTIIAAGNHEYYHYEDNLALGVMKFEEATGQDIDKLYWINGQVPVIKMGMTSTSEEENYYDRHDFIKASLEEIDRSGWDGHIFLICHTPFGDTVYGSSPSSKDGFSDETEALLKKYPQIIQVSGHSHYNPITAQFIDQSAGFTCIADGTIGKEFDDGFKEGPKIGSTGIIFDVMKDGTTKIYRVDFQNGRILFDHEDWTLDASDKAEDFIYFADPDEAKNPDAYVHKASAPYFTEDQKIHLRDIGNNDTIEITFPKAKTKTNNNYDYVFSYTIKAIDKNGKADTRQITVPNNEHLPNGYGSDTITAQITGLEWDTDYYVEIYADSCFDLRSNTLRSDSCVNVGSRTIDYNAKLIYDIDYSYGTAFDFMGHSANIMDFIKIQHDESIGRYAANFIGYGTNAYFYKEEDLESTRYNLTFEAYVNIAPSDKQQEIFSNLASGGFSLGVSKGNTYVRLVSHSEGVSNCCISPMPMNQWVHLLVTYDSQDVVLYINGEEASRQKCRGGISAEYDPTASEDELSIQVGGRRKTGEEAFLLQNGSKINFIRIYSGTMDKTAVKKAYEDAKLPVKPFNFKDIKDNAWYRDSVLYAYKNGLMNGTSDTIFAPATNTSRAMIVQMLYNIEGKPKVEYKNTFTDVKKNAWYADAVTWAYENGVTTGTSANTFSPDTLVTREQVAVFLYRYLKDYKKAEMEEGADLSVFPDANKISRYDGFAEAVAWANATGIVNGKKNGDAIMLAPLDKAQRSETATMFARFHRASLKVK